MTKAIALAVLMLFGVGLESALACSVPRIRTLDNQTVSGHMAAVSGKPCRIRFTSSSSAMSGADIVQRPSNGTVRVGGRDGIIYTSRAGLVGGDSFTYARRGVSRGNQPVTRTVNVAVTVRP
jgi:hypothetical protein